MVSSFNYPIGFRLPHQSKAALYPPPSSKAAGGNNPRCTVSRYQFSAAAP